VYSWELFKARQITYKKLMLLGYNESCLKASFCKFYGRFNDLVCDYKLSLAHMLKDLFHILCQTVIYRLALRTGLPVYLITTKGAWRRVWLVGRGCLLFLTLHLLEVRDVPQSILYLEAATNHVFGIFLLLWIFISNIRYHWNSKKKSTL
jgi:hypothetical protein